MDLCAIYLFRIRYRVDDDDEEEGESSNVLVAHISTWGDGLIKWRQWKKKYGNYKLLSASETAQVAHVRHCDGL